MSVCAAIAVCLLAAAEPAGTDPLVACKEQIERSFQGHVSAVALAQTAYADAVRRARLRTVAECERVARDAVKGGRLDEAAAAWRQALVYDRGHAQARAFFELGERLDAVLDDLAAPKPATDPLGNPIAGQQAAASPTPLPTALRTAVDSHDRGIVDARKAFYVAEQTSRKRAEEEGQRARARVLETQVRAAQSAQRGGDLAAAAKSWRVVLAVDGEHAEAVKFFSGLGTLAKVREEVAGALPAAPAAAEPRDPEPWTTRTALLVVADQGPAPQERIIAERLTQGGWAVRHRGAAAVDARLCSHERLVVLLPSAASVPAVLAATQAGLAVMRSAGVGGVLEGIAIAAETHGDDKLVLADHPIAGTAKGSTVTVFREKARMMLASADPALIAASSAVKPETAQPPDEGEAQRRGPGRGRRGRADWPEWRKRIEDLPPEWREAAKRELEKNGLRLDDPGPEQEQPAPPKALMAGRPERAGAAGRRLLPFPVVDDLPKLTDAGWKLLLASLTWAADGPAPAPLLADAKRANDAAAPAK